MPETIVRVNRAPVLTLWAAVVAERLGHDREFALTLGKAVARMNAQAKGRRLGIYSEKPTGKPDRRSTPGGETRDLVLVELLGRGIPARRTETGVRAVVIDPFAGQRTSGRDVDRRWGCGPEVGRTLLSVNVVPRRRA